MNKCINTADSVLPRLSIIEKARILSWYKDVDFGKGIIVNVDKSGNGTERFYVTHADIDGIYVYPVSDFYGPQDADLLENWGGGIIPYIEKDADSKEMERFIDEGLRTTGIDKENPVVQKLHKYHPDSVIFKGE